MAKYTIVQFPDNTYGLQKKTWFDKRYLSKNNWNHCFEQAEYIYSYCRFETLYAAQNALAFIKQEYKELKG